MPPRGPSSTCSLAVCARPFPACRPRSPTLLLRLGLRARRVRHWGPAGVPPPGLPSLSVVSPALAPGLASSCRAPGGRAQLPSVHSELPDSGDGRRRNVLSPTSRSAGVWRPRRFVSTAGCTVLTCAVVGLRVRAREWGLACDFPRDLDLLQALGCAASHGSRELSLVFVLGKGHCGRAASSLDVAGRWHSVCSCNSRCGKRAAGSRRGGGTGLCGFSRAGAGPTHGPATCPFSS